MHTLSVGTVTGTGAHVDSIICQEATLGLAANIASVACVVTEKNFVKCGHLTVYKNISKKVVERRFDTEQTHQEIHDYNLRCDCLACETTNSRFFTRLTSILLTCCNNQSDKTF